jgi:hypothetical protein
MMKHAYNPALDERLRQDKIIQGQWRPHSKTASKFLKRQNDTLQSNFAHILSSLIPIIGLQGRQGRQEQLCLTDRKRRATASVLMAKTLFLLEF